MSINMWLAIIISFNFKAETHVGFIPETVSERLFEASNNLLIVVKKNVVIFLCCKFLIQMFYDF